MTTLAEPEWDQATRDLVLALDAVPRCPICGRDPAVCQDPDLQDSWVAEDPIRCHATTALRSRQDRARANHEHLDALMWPLRLDDNATPRAGG